MSRRLRRGGREGGGGGRSVACASLSVRMFVEFKLLEADSMATPLSQVARAQKRASHSTKREESGVCKQMVSVRLSVLAKEILWVGKGRKEDSDASLVNYTYSFCPRVECTSESFLHSVSRPALIQSSILLHSLHSLEGV